LPAYGLLDDASFDGDDRWDGLARDVVVRKGSATPAQGAERDDTDEEQERRRGKESQEEKQ